METLFDIPDEFKHMIRIYRVNVEVVLEQEREVAASIKPLHDSDGSEDILAIEEYESFIINALGIFDIHDFAVIRELESDRSHSVYYTLVKKDQLEHMDYKYILFIRISDHPIKEVSRPGAKGYYNEAAQELKQPDTKSKQVWRLKEITVNNDTFFSYDEALDYIDKILP